VLVRDPAGKRAPQAFFSTDTALAPAEIIAIFVRRWQVEVTFSEVRAHLGVETQRQGVSPTRRGRLMATVTQVYTVAYVAKLLDEDEEMLEAIVYNDDNLSYGAITSVHTGAEEAITALTDDGIGELRDMLADARRSTQHWHDFLEDFVSDPDIIARVKEKGPR